MSQGTIAIWSSDFVAVRRVLRMKVTVAESKREIHRLAPPSMRSLLGGALEWMASVVYLSLTLFTLVLVVWFSKRSYARGNTQRRRVLLAQLGITEDDERGERRIAGFFHPYWSVKHAPRRFVCDL